MLYYLTLISLSPQSDIQTAVKRVGFSLMFAGPYQPTLVFVLVPQVFVSCNFCGKSISYSCSAMPHQGRGFSQYGVSGSPTKSKVTSCPGCRKPLPRCALCLMNMGTPVSNCPGKLAFLLPTHIRFFSGLHAWLLSLSYVVRDLIHIRHKAVWPEWDGSYQNPCGCLSVRVFSLSAVVISHCQQRGHFLQSVYWWNTNHNGGVVVEGSSHTDDWLFAVLQSNILCIHLLRARPFSQSRYTSGLTNATFFVAGGDGKRLVQKLFWMCPCRPFLRNRCCHICISYYYTTVGHL